MKKQVKALAAAILTALLMALTSSVDAQAPANPLPDAVQCQKTVEAIRLNLEKARGAKLEAAVITIGAATAGTACLLSQRLDAPDARVRWAGYGILAAGVGYGVAKYVAAERFTRRAHTLTLSPSGVGYALKF